jgi:hypothetical protein
MTSWAYERLLRRPAKEDNLYLDWVGVMAVFEVTRLSGRSAFAGPVHRPTQIKSLKLDRVQERKPSA